jgi:tetratricopeptide (TPR) repeat protein
MSSWDHRSHGQFYENEISPETEGNSMRRLITVTILLIVLCCVPGYAQDGIDHGPTGTLNLDYFNPTGDAHITWLKADQDKYHTIPAIKDFARGDMKGTRLGLEWILVRFINHPQALALAAAFSIATKNSMWAIPHFERALGIYPQYALTHAQYGKYLTDIGMVDKGLEQLNKAAEMDPKLIAVQVWLAAAYSKSGNADLAREAAEKARSLGYKGDLAQYGLKQ